MAIYAGIDSGTQSTKVLLIGDDGAVRGRGQVGYGLIEGLPPGHKEQHPALWVEALAEAFRLAVADAGVSAMEVVAIGVSGQQHGFVALDGAGQPIRPAKLWCDTATAAEGAALMEALGGPEAWRRATGNGLPAGFTASKIAWLKRHEPENFARLRTVLLPHDYLNFWLTGVARMEWGDASGTGLMEVRARRWHPDAVRAVDERLAEWLPPLRSSAEPCGTVRPEAARLLGLRPDVVVSAGGGDNMMGAIGTGNVVPGVLTVSLGTSGTIYAFSAEPVVDAACGEVAAFCDSTGAGWLPLLCTMNVTVATELTKRTFGMSTEELNRAAEDVPAGAEGLMLLPYFEGERTPDVPDGTGVWFGYSGRTATPGHFARAAMEGATLGLGYGYRRLRELGIEAREIRLTGGGSRSALWRGIVADVFGAPVVCTTEPEGAALGAALQAMAAAGAASIAEACARAVALDPATRAEPDAGRVALYAEAQDRHNLLSRQLRPVFGRRSSGG